MTGKPKHGDERVDSVASEHDHPFEPRVEDDALVRGLGRFVEDTPQPGQAHAVFVRSPHAHARIASIDTSARKPRRVSSRC